MIQLATIQALVDEAGLDISDVSHIEIDTERVTFTLFAKTPDGQFLSYLGSVMFTQQIHGIERPHVHDGTEDHVHD